MIDNLSPRELENIFKKLFFVEDLKITNIKFAEPDYGALDEQFGQIVTMVMLKKKIESKVEYCEQVATVIARDCSFDITMWDARDAKAKISKDMTLRYQSYVKEALEKFDKKLAKEYQSECDDHNKLFFPKEREM